MRWVGWKRVSAGNPWGDGTIDNALERGAVVHAVEGKVGGYSDEGHGDEGRALCGVRVPADNPSFIAWWVIEGRRPTRRCKRCARKAAAL